MGGRGEELDGAQWRMHCAPHPERSRWPSTGELVKPPG